MPAHDEAIAEISEALAKQRADMEGAAEQFRTATSAMLETLWPQLTKTAVTTQQPERAKELGTEGLAALKVELDHLVENAPAAVTEHLGSDALWSHRSVTTDEEVRSSPEIPSMYDVDRHRMPDIVHRAICNAGARLAPLLDERGLTDGDPAGWPFLRRGGSVELYPHSVKWTDEMRDVMGRYSEMHREMLRLENALAEAKRARTEAEASDLWDAS